MQGFSLKENVNYSKIKRYIPTTAGLFSGNQRSDSFLRCVFCDKDNHEPKDCHVARNMNLDEKTAKMKKRGCCFRMHVMCPKNVGSESTVRTVENDIML